MVFFAVLPMISGHISTAIGHNLYPPLLLTISTTTDPGPKAMALDAIRISIAAV